MSSEERLVTWLRGRLARLQKRDWLGDDAALIKSTADVWAVSVDQQVEGVHFPVGLDARTVGRRLVAVCLSDLAASGAEPLYCTLTVALPAGYPARRLLIGVLEGCGRHGVELIGGDTSSTMSRLACTLTVFGHRPPKGNWLRRSAGKVGDELWIGGTLGESALGRRLLQAGVSLAGRSIVFPAALRGSQRRMREARRAVRRHLLPTPQLDLGTRLGRRQRVAALDVSDGLSIDLHRLCRESGVGAEIQLKALPTPPGLEHWCSRLGVSSDHLVLEGGEDYVLLFTLPSASKRAPQGCHRIGSLTTQTDVQLITESGSRPLSAKGWDHLSPR